MDRKAKAAELRGREVRRCTAKLELRDTGDGLTLDGYACVTGVGYDMGWYTEQVRRGAFTKTLSETPDVQLLVNHEGLPLARTLSGTLELEEDSHGLHMSAQVDATDPDVDRVVRKMRRQDIDQMSFAFRATRQEWDEDYEAREIIECSIDRGDVSIVNQGANPATSVSFRSFLAAIEDKDPGQVKELRRMLTLAALVEKRAGKSLSAATTTILTDILSGLADADDNIDDALEALSALLGVPNPDEPEDDQKNSAMSLDVALAIAESYRRKAA